VKTQEIPKCVKFGFLFETLFGTSMKTLTTVGFEKGWVFQIAIQYWLLTITFDLGIRIAQKTGIGLWLSNRTEPRRENVRKEPMRLVWCRRNRGIGQKGLFSEDEAPHVLDRTIERH
jgi:hypothetical protein